MQKIAFRLYTKEAVEYANAHRINDVDYGNIFYQAYYFHNCPVLDGGHISDVVEPGYTDVTENFEMDYWGPWNDRIKLEAKERAAHTMTLKDVGEADSEHIHIPLKNIDGHITVSKSVCPEIIEALNKMAELAYQSLTPKQ